MLKVILSVCFSSIFAALVYLGWLYTDLQKTLNEPMNITEATVFKVNSGDSMKLIASKLEQLEYYQHPEVLRLIARQNKLDSKIQVGDYRLTENITPNEFLTLITEGKVIQHNVILIEGLNFRQTLARLAKQEDLRHELTGLSEQQIMEKLGKPKEHPEGRFFPDNYFYTSGTSDLEILKRAYTAMESVSKKLWDEREKDLPYKNLYEAQIMASIIEKETGKASERPEIAGVFVRRLRKGMKLQTDPTVIYGIGPSFDGNITRKHLRTDTPYNTYTRQGLPPSPIAMFGEASLKAALHPAKGDALFFVSKGDGSHYFSATLAEHNKAVREYQLK